MFRYILLCLIALCYIPLACIGMDAGVGEPDWLIKSREILVKKQLFAASPFVEADSGSLLVVRDQNDKPIATVKHMFIKNDPIEEHDRQESIFRERFFYQIAEFFGMSDCVAPNCIVATDSSWKPKNKRYYSTGKRCIFEKFIPLKNEGTEVPESLKEAVKGLEKKQEYGDHISMVCLYEESKKFTQVDKGRVIDALDVLSLQKILLLYMLCDLTDCTHRNTLLQIVGEKLKPIMIDQGESFGKVHQEGPFKPNVLVLGDLATKPIPAELIKTLKSHTTKELKSFVSVLREEYKVNWLLSKTDEEELYSRHNDLLTHANLLATIPLAEFMLNHWMGKNAFREVFKRGKIAGSRYGFNFDGLNAIPETHKSGKYLKTCYVKAVGENEEVPAATQTFNKPRRYYDDGECYMS